MPQVQIFIGLTLRNRKKKFSKKDEKVKKDNTFEEINDKRIGGKETKKHDYSKIFDEDYQRSWGIPDFKDETDVKTLNDIVEKAMGLGDEGSIDISNNAMERLEELVKFSPEEQDKMASGTGEEIMDILRSKEKTNEFEKEIKSTADKIRSSGDRYTYMMLDRMKSDVKYVLGNGGKGAIKELWYDGDIRKHIALMKELHNGLKEKPEWLSYKEIEEYEQKLKNL